MEKIVWTTDLSVGVAEIDEQHQKLYAIIQELMIAQRSVPNNKAILSILTQLADYSDYHFRSEDNFMIEHNYPLFLSHRKEHLAFIKKLGDLIDGLNSGKATLTDDILAFLCNWWDTHICQSDLKYARYIKAQPEA